MSQTLWNSSDTEHEPDQLLDACEIQQLSAVPYNTTIPSTLITTLNLVDLPCTFYLVILLAG